MSQKEAKRGQVLELLKEGKISQQEQLADYFGVHFTTVGRIVRGG